MSEKQRESRCGFCKDVINPKNCRVGNIYGISYHNASWEKFLDGFYKKHGRAAKFSYGSGLINYNDISEIQKYLLVRPPHLRPCLSIFILSSGLGVKEVRSYRSRI